jgi:hypothetical protein
LSDFNETGILSPDFRKKKNSKISNFKKKIRPVGAESLYVDGQAGRQTDMMKLIVAFRNFAKALKI